MSRRNNSSRRRNYGRRQHEFASAARGPGHTIGRGIGR